MLKTLNAVYSNGTLVLEEKLGTEWEGKTLQITIKVEKFEETEEREARVKRFFDEVDKHQINLPPDYKFDRDELYER